jgi:hypothetical protein
MYRAEKDPGGKTSGFLKKQNGRRRPSVSASGGAKVYYKTVNFAAGRLRIFAAVL